jgi:hypothetical protein
MITPLTRLQIRMVELQIAPAYDDAAWRTLHDGARVASVVGELLEATFAAAVTARRRGAHEAAMFWIERGRELAADSPRWARRFASLANG